MANKFVLIFEADLHHQAWLILPTLLEFLERNLTSKYNLKLEPLLVKLMTKWYQLNLSLQLQNKLYTGFQVNFPNFRYLRPVVTMGKFGPSAADPARLTLPFTLQIHHATADGWHASEAVRRIVLATR